MSDTPPDVRAQAVARFEQMVSSKKVAEELGLDVREVKAWRLEWKGGKPSRTGARVREAKPRTQGGAAGAAKERLAMTFVHWAEDKSIQAETVLGFLMKQIAANEKVNMAGFAAMFTRAREAREHVEIIRKTTGQGHGTAEELRAQMLQSMEEWPDEYLELAFRVYSERHNGQALFVAKGGHKTEFDLDANTWVTSEG